MGKWSTAGRKQERARKRELFWQDVSDTCRDCGTGITIPGTRARGISRCNSCDLEAGA